MKPRVVEHRCAKCATVVGRSRVRRIAIGKPFVICWTCGAFVPCAPFNEWDFLDPPTKVRYVATVALQALVFGVIPGLAYGVGAVALQGDYDLRVFLIVLAAGLLLVAAGRILEFSAHVRRSQRRVSDPMYRAKLVEFGMGAGGSRAGGSTPTPSGSNP